MEVVSSCADSDNSPRQAILAAIVSFEDSQKSEAYLAGRLIDFWGYFVPSPSQQQPSLIAGFSCKRAANSELIARKGNFL